MAEKTLLFLHICAVFVFVSGFVAFHAADATSRHYERPDIVVTLHYLIRRSNRFMNIGSRGAILTGFGLVLAQHDRLLRVWIIASVVLWLISESVPSLAGGHYGRRLERSRVAADSPLGPTSEDIAILHDRYLFWVEAAGSACVVAILALMVWRPT